jgi:hypothetical protein
MAIVMPDKTARSGRLTGPHEALGGKRISKLAFWAYSYFVATLRDDFARFQFSARLCLPKLAPQRPDITEREVEQLLMEYEAAGLLKTWMVGDVVFAEWYKGIQKGKYHQTPEPPWSEHHHAGWCWNTAIRQARLWTPGQVENMLRRRNDLHRVDQEERQVVRQVVDQEERQVVRPLPPSSPSSPSATRINGTPIVPTRQKSTEVFNRPNGDGQQRPPVPPANAGGQAPISDHRAGQRKVRELVEQARLFAITANQHPTRDDLNIIRGWFKAGHTLAKVQEAIENGTLYDERTRKQRQKGRTA